MTRGRKIFAVVSAALLAGGFGARALAAPINPAQWTVAGRASRPLTPGATFRLTLSAHLQPGWHIYALEEPDGGPIATVIGVAEGDPATLLAVDEPQPTMVPDPVLHQATGMFQNVVGFTLHLRAGQKPLAADAVSHILVRYQTCNDQVCLPPHTETVAFPLKALTR